MTTQQQIDEILELLWMQREQGQNDLCLVEKEANNLQEPNLLTEMEATGWIRKSGQQMAFTDKGEKAATQLIRRHRLAERLLVDILDTTKERVEAPACQFEHMVSEEVTEAICTLLGHPKMCPHGLPIPEGKCCESARQQVASLIIPLDQVALGDWVTIAYVLSHHHPRLHKLMSFGIAPGVKIKVHQKSPAYVIQVEETQIALEAEIVRDIFVRRG